MKKYTIEPYDEEDHSQQNFEREEAYLRAKKKVDEIRGFYIHLLVYLIINIFLIVTITRHSDQSLFSFGTFSTPVFWGIGLFFHFLGVFGKDLLFGKAWEQRQIDKYMEENNKRWE